MYIYIYIYIYIYTYVFGLVRRKGPRTAASSQTAAAASPGSNPC